ncbi:MAG: asparagine synthase (glutamine-hydrolyzing) [Planctomycetota bacterium]
MCGILGIVATWGDEPGITDAQAIRMRDTMAHRGPDGAGLWRAGPVVLGHRRLAVVDPTDAGAQPMVSADARQSLVYNGELYNDAELRTALEAEGVAFRTSCDTETVLAALVRWGPEAFSRFRGMYSLGFVDLDRRRLLLARDPLGVKPMCWARVGGRLVFASEPTAVLKHPDVRPAPDLVSLSAYLTTIRTTLAERTMFDGVRSLPPGTVLCFDLNDQRLQETATRFEPPEVSAPVRNVVRESVGAHLRSDVPVCTLLSGGLDSSVCALVAREQISDLRSYCAGAADSPPGGDFDHANLVASRLGTRHREARLDAERFDALWREMVDRLAVPLSTPNETAIHAVATALRTDGCIVTLSGEGADELFGGYEGPLLAALAHVESGNDDPGMFHADSAAWVPRELKHAVLLPEVFEAAAHDQQLIDSYRQTFEQNSRGDEPMADHLRMLRAVNLTGLLGRLDTATMLASVEGRTPFADAIVAGCAEALPMTARFGRTEDGVFTKRALREAFEGDLPPEIVSRPKASFPLPFQAWMAPAMDRLASSAFARSVFCPEAIETVARDPSAHWHLAWPMANVAMWGDRWWPQAERGSIGTAAMSSAV